jgi:hypothetical protein
MFSCQKIDFKNDTPRAGALQEEHNSDLVIWNPNCLVPCRVSQQEPKQADVYEYMKSANLRGH